MNRGIVARCLTLAPLAALLTLGPAAGATDLDDQLQLNTSITVTGSDVLLGDVFAGYLSRPEKVVAQAPRPGQRMVLTSEWLSKLAYTYGLGWQPTSSFDRAVVYQPGQTIAAQEILSVVKSDLIAKGMPANFTLAPTVQVPSVTVAADADVTTAVGVREAFFNAQNQTFSAVIEIPPGTPDAQFVSVRGTAYPVVTVPALKENASKNTLITEAMLTTLEVPESQIRPDTITDPSLLLGKAPKVYLKAGVPVRDTDVARMTLIDVPVLTANMSRDGKIAEHALTFATFNAADLPGDVVTDVDQLVGYSPRRLLTAGVPLRRGDVQLVREVQVPVAIRELARGETLQASDISWITMNDTDVISHALQDEDEIVGLMAKHTIRAGQTLRGYDVARPIAVTRGKLVTILWSTAMMNLTVQGKALEPGSVGDVIRVSNTKSKAPVMAEVVNETTVRITAQ